MPKVKGCEWAKAYILSYGFNMTSLGMCFPIYYVLCMTWIVVGGMHCLEAITGNSATDCA